MGKPHVCAYGDSGRGVHSIFYYIDTAQPTFFKFWNHSLFSRSAVYVIGAPLPISDLMEGQRPSKKTVMIDLFNHKHTRTKRERERERKKETERERERERERGREKKKSERERALYTSSQYLAHHFSHCSHSSLMIKEGEQSPLSLSRCSTIHPLYRPSSSLTTP